MDTGPSFTTRAKGTQLIRTCQNCVAAKVKCHRQPKSTVCDRCQRLGKECHYREARRKQHGDESDARIEALEAKIDQLLSSQPVDTPRTPQTQDTAISSQESSTDPEPASNLRYVASAGIQSSYSMPDSRESSMPANILEGFFTSDEANKLLNTFRLTMSHHFPFVIIPPHMTAEDLASQRPFLLLASLTAASHENMPLQKHLCDEVKSTINDRIIMEGDISLDMLQGLLVYLAWCHYHPRPRQYLQFINLAMALVSEWSLDVPSKHEDWKTKMSYRKGDILADTSSSDAFAGEHTGSSNRTNRMRTAEEYRAMLGCFYLAANIAVLLGKRNAFTYSLFIEEVARYFTDNPEYPTDKYLLYHVQFQKLLEKIDRISINRSENMDATHVIGAWAATLKAELDLLKESMPFPIEESFPLAMQIRSTELFLHQISLPDKHYPQSRGPTSWDPMRTELLSAGLLATTQTFQTYLALPFNADKAFSNPEWIQIATALLIGSKLAVASAAQAVARQTQSLRRMLAFGAILKQLRVRLGAIISPLVDSRGDRDVFFHFENRVARVERWYQENYAKATELNVMPAETTFVPIGTGVDPIWSTGLGPTGPPTHSPIPDMPGIIIDDAYQAAGLDSDPLSIDPNFSYYFPDSVVTEIMGGWTSEAPPPT